jgi:acyl-CoA thioester hydrolase
VIGHGVWREKTGTPIADGESTVVYFDYAKQQSTRIPDELRQKIAEIEGRMPENGRPDAARPGV